MLRNLPVLSKVHTGRAQIHAYRLFLFQSQRAHAQTYSHNLKTPHGQTVVIKIWPVLRPAAPLLLRRDELTHAHTHSLMNTSTHMNTRRLN